MTGWEVQGKAIHGGVYCYLTGGSWAWAINRTACAYGSSNVYTSGNNTVLRGQRYLIEYHLSPNQGLQTYINGILQLTHSYDNPTVTIPWYLFANNTEGSVDTSRSAKIKLFSFEMEKQNQTVRTLVPCYRKSDNKPGMYDLVTKTFFTNANTSATTDFIVGADVN